MYQHRMASSVPVAIATGVHPSAGVAPTRRAGEKVCHHRPVATIDLGEVGPEEFDPGRLVVAPETRRRGVLALLLATVVLIGAAGAVPPAHAVQASALADLADVERVDIAGDIAIGVLPDDGDVV